VNREREMETWIPEIRRLLERRLRVFAYFNNHYGLCRCRHNPNNAVSRIMPTSIVPPAVFPHHSSLVVRADA